MKKLLLHLFLVIVTPIFAFAQTIPAAQAGEKLEYSDWLFIQSDKALQYRMARAKQVDDVCYIQLQIRLNKDDQIYCKDQDCKGYIWFFNYSPESGESFTSHIIIRNSYEGVYSYNQLIPVKLKKIGGGGELYWNENEKRLKFKESDGSERYQQFGWSCVDNELKSTTANRCSSFKMSEAVVLD